MEIIELIGYTAAFLTTMAFLPQVIKTYKSKSAKDLSLGMFLIFTLGVSLWLIYGIAIEKTPIIIANLITLILAITLVFFKLKFKK